MSKPRTQFKALGNYIGGEFRKPNDPNGELIGKSPADFTDETARFPYSYKSVEDAVVSAKRAFKAWRTRPFSERLDFLKKYQEAIRKREEIFCEAMAREVGKPLWEAKTEVVAMIGKVDVSAVDGMRLIQDFNVENIMAGTNGACHYRAHGVMAVIGPFNFPGHLPNGHFVPALLTGNTVVFKPSEKAPVTGQLIAECFQEAGIPAGVFNLVQGEKEVGRRLSAHEGVDGVLFTGSYEVGTRIKQDTLQQHWKLLALEMGGKNSAIVWEDADLDFAIHETLTGAYITAGQRCSATSRIMVHRKFLDEFISKFHQRAKSFTIGHPMENPFMGPLIEPAAVDRYMKFLGIAAREGSEIVMRGKSLELDYSGNYVAPSICWVKEPSVDSIRKSIYQQTELFAPNVAILPVDDLETAIEYANATQFGLVASVFSRKRAVFEKCRENLEMGLINWNRSTVGASSRLPFGGLKKSGNHFPTALHASLYCTSPIASLETAEPQQPESYFPGLNWK